MALRMPKVGELMTQGTVRLAPLSEGARIAPGASLFEVRVDLSARGTLDCPPIYYFRLVAREAGFVRRLECKAGGVAQVGDVLAWIASTPDDPLEAAGRDSRAASVGIQVDPVFG